MDQNLVVWSQLKRKQRREKEADIPWFMQKANKAPGTGLALFTKASGAVSRGRRCRAPSQEGLRSPGRKVNPEDLCAPGDQPEKEREWERERQRERERERERARHRDQSSDRAEVFYSTLCRYLYCLTR